MLDEVLLTSLQVHLKAQAIRVAIDDLLPVGLDSAGEPLRNSRLQISGDLHQRLDLTRI